MVLNLVIDSDLHFRDGKIRADKADHAGVIADLAASGVVDAMICAGDLTDQGTDGRRFLCWCYGGIDDQLTPLREFVQGIATKIPVYIGAGNHDQYVPWPYLHKGVFDYIVERHGVRLYSWNLVYDDVNYHFICLDIYPDAKGREFLVADIKEHFASSYTRTGLIIYFHYNVEGEYGDWWSDADKEAFLDCLEPYAGFVRLIIVGHRHENYLIKWNGYNVVSGAGSAVLVCSIDGTAVSIKEYQ